MDFVSHRHTTEINALADLVEGARNAAPVSGLTHNFYRYPARFSPAFVRAAIQTFSEPGDWVFDPFAGGGTTLVEAVAHGRHAIGTDISSLATFVCEAKTLLLEDEDVLVLRQWSSRLSDIVNMHSPGGRDKGYADAGYYRNLEGPTYWRLRKAIEQVLKSIARLQSRNAQLLARCVLLKTAQWALDARKTLPSVVKFRAELVLQSAAMIDAALELSARVQGYGAKQRPKVVCLNRSADGLEGDPRIARLGTPKLIVTSPPYPGIHVLYHRWQVDGRKEAPAPFWIADRLDGAGLSHYTMGDRKNPGLETYFENLDAAFQSIAEISGPNTTIVQMVAFSEPNWQLARYLEIMEDCGLMEMRPWSSTQAGHDGRLWRDVPNRKWHAQQKSHAPGSKEVVLVHRKVR